MQRNKFSAILLSSLIIAAVTLMLTGGASAASKYKVLYRFTGGADGSRPAGSLVFDTAGNLYGTTQFGGDPPYPYGVVFKLTPNLDGSWSESVLHNFGGDPNPYPTGSLLLDGSGNLYGMTSGWTYGSGVVFKLSPNSDGTWTENVIGGAGLNLAGSLMWDAAGNLYGAAAGDYFGNGEMVFKLTPNVDGTWTTSIIYWFLYTDGSPRGSLVLDPAGNLYGTTGIDYFGNGDVVFKLTPNADGTWSESALYRFTGGQDGTSPNGGLVLDSAGNLYGTTNKGGSYGFGTIFGMKPTSDGGWTMSTLHQFTGGRDGGNSTAGLMLDPAGNLYGTTSTGGTAGCGTAFKLQRNPGRGWIFSVVREFAVGNGRNPLGGLIRDAAGNLYGTTEYGGAYASGVVFEITSANMK